MPYIGKNPVGGGFHKLDALTASATATYALTLNSAAYFPETANQLLVSLNGVIQAPQDSFTVSGSNLIFDTALTASDSIDFVVALGDVLGVGSVTDGAVTANKIGNGAVTKAKMGTTELDLATIKDSTGTNTAMTIDSSGRVLTPARPAFWATSTGATHTTNSGSVLDFDEVVINKGNHYNASTYTFTAPVAGVYNFYFQIYESGNGTSAKSVAFQKNSSDYAPEDTAIAYQGGTNIGNHTLGSNILMDLAVNDTIRIAVRSGSPNVQWYGGHSWFQGYLIG